jgi:hypothetical protein
MRHPALLHLIYLAVTVAIVALAAPPRVLDRRISLAAVATLVLLLPLGQVLNDQRRSYPFVSWTMYSTAMPASYRDYVIVDDEERESRYPFHLIAFSSPWAFMARLDRAIGRCRCAQGDPLVDATLAGLARIYERRIGHRVAEFRVYDVAVSPAAAAPRLLYVWDGDVGR